MTENKDDPDCVRFCLECGCRTWHHGKICEWTSHHKPDRIRCTNELKTGNNGEATP